MIKIKNFQEDLNEYQELKKNHVHLLEEIKKINE